MAAKGSALGQLEETLELYLVKKAPFQLPTSAKELIVKLAPWITIVVMVIALPGILAVLGLGALGGILTGLLGPLAAAQYASSMTFTVIVLLVSVVLELLAIPGLFARSIRGWRLVYWATLVSGVASLLSFATFFNGVISTLIGLYFLFQVKSYYK